MQTVVALSSAWGLEDIHRVDILEVPVVKSCLFLAGVLDSIFDDAVLGWERFVALCELQTSFFSTLLIEFCTDSKSSLSSAGVDYSVFVIPVTLEVD